MESFIRTRVETDHRLLSREEELLKARRDAYNYLRSCELFKRLGTRELSQVAEGVEVIEYQPGEAIITEGAVADGMFVLRTGEVIVKKSFPKEIDYSARRFSVADEGLEEGAPVGTGLEPAVRVPRWPHTRPPLSVRGAGPRAGRRRAFRGQSPRQPVCGVLLRRARPAQRGAACGDHRGQDALHLPLRQPGRFQSESWSLEPAWHGARPLLARCSLSLSLVAVDPACVTGAHGPAAS